jgi:DNA modification methylase
MTDADAPSAAPAAPKPKPKPKRTEPAKAALELRPWPADQTERWSLDRIKEYPNNARVHSPEQIQSIVASMKKFGVTTPVLVDEEGVLIFGHGRLAAAKLLNYPTIPVSTARGWTEDEKRAYRIADNAIQDNSAFDLPLLRAEIGELKLAGFDLQLLGFPELKLVQFMAGQGTVDPEATPEPPKNPVSKTGDLWLLGAGHRLLCGDATSEADVARCLGSEKPHLCVSDAPYGVNYDPDWRNRADRANGKPYGASAVGQVTNDDRTDWSAAWALFPGDVIYAWSPAGSRQLETGSALERCAFEIRQQIIWVKTRLIIGRGNYHYRHEPRWYAVRKGKGAHWNGARDQDTAWEIAHAKSETGHSTQKPIECMKRPIENNSKAGDAVYDPFVGSGTTIIAAEMTARKALAIEIDPIYCDVAVERWQNFAGKEATLEATGKTFAQVRAERQKPPPRKRGNGSGAAAQPRKPLKDGGTAAEQVPETEAAE